MYNLMEEDEEEEEEEEDTSVTSGAQTPVTPKILMHPAQSDDDFPTPVHTGNRGENTQYSGVNKSAPNEDSLSQNYDRTSTSTIVEESEDLQSAAETEKT